jgi:pimeloyl-ACP methyl ester carboxylesterase
VDLLLLPGLDGTEVFFSPLRAQLPSWLRTTVVEYPQFGPTRYEDLEPVVERAAARMSEFFVLGWSFGGPLALRLAAKRPDSVLGVVLAASFVRPPRPELARFRRGIVAPVLFTVRALRRVRFVSRRFATPELRRAKGETWRRARSGALAERARSALSVDARADLAACRAPILYLASTKDSSVPLHNVDDVLAGAPRAQVAQIPGAHLALFTHAQEAARALVDFVEPLSPPR